jgi:hypothetical protein
MRRIWRRSYGIASARFRLPAPSARASARQYLQERLLPVASSNIIDYFEADGGKLKLKDLAALDRGLTAAIASLKIDGKTGDVTLRLWDKVSATATLLKAIGGMPADKLEVTGKDGGPLKFEWTGLELIRRLLWLVGLQAEDPRHLTVLAWGLREVAKKADARLH